MMFRGFIECIFLEKVNTALQNLENHKVLLKDPVRPIEGPYDNIIIIIVVLFAK